MSTNLPEPVSMTLKSLVPSVVRTLVPIVVALLVRLGFSDTAIDNAWLERALTVVVVMAYYVAVRVLEQNWDKIGWLLGYPAQPVYVKGQVLAATEFKTPPTNTTEVISDEGISEDNVM